MPVGPSASQRRRSYRALSAAGGSEVQCLPVFAAAGASLQNSCYTFLAPCVLEGMRSQLPPAAQSAVSVVAEENPYPSTVVESPTSTAVYSSAAGSSARQCSALRERANYPGRRASVPASVLSDEDPTEDSGLLVVHAPAKCIVLFLEHLATRTNTKPNALHALLAVRR